MSIRGLSADDRAAVVVSECQNAMVLEELRGSRDELAQNVAKGRVLDSIAALAAEARACGVPVVHSLLVPHPNFAGFAVSCPLAGVVRRTGHVVEGHLGAAPHVTVAPRSGDLVIRRRTGMTSFENTELDGMLRALDVNTIVLVGVSVNVAVFGTAIEAVNRGYQVVVPRDCVAGVGDLVEPILDLQMPLLAAMSDSSAVKAEFRRNTAAVSHRGC